MGQPSGLQVEGLALLKHQSFYPALVRTQTKRRTAFHPLLMPATAESWAKRLKQAARFAFYEGGWRGGLSRFAGLVSSLGIINGVIDWFLRWIGHPTRDSQPLWFSILCALVFPMVVVIDVKLSRKAARPEPAFTDQVK